MLLCITRLLPQAVPYLFCLFLKNKRQRFVNQLCAEKRRGALSFDVRIFSQIHPDHAAFTRQRPNQADRFVPAESPGSGVPVAETKDGSSPSMSIVR